MSQLDGFIDVAVPVSFNDLVEPFGMKTGGDGTKR